MSDNDGYSRRKYNEGGLVGPTHQRDYPKPAPEAEQPAAAAEQAFEGSDTAQPAPDGAETAPAAQVSQAPGIPSATQLGQVDQKTGFEVKRPAAIEEVGA